MGQVSWWYFPLENERTAATASGIITYIHNQTLINFLFKEQTPKQLNSSLTWQGCFPLVRWDRQNIYFSREALTLPESFYVVLPLVPGIAIPLNIFPKLLFRLFLIYPQCCTWPFRSFSNLKTSWHAPEFLISNIRNCKALRWFRASINQGTEWPVKWVFCLTMETIVSTSYWKSLENKIC